MSLTKTSPTVAVIGGGIIGVSIAVHLARRGAAVTLLTESELASEATGRSLSWLNSAGIRSRAYHELRLAGIDRYRTLFAQDPSREWLRFDGGLRWTSSATKNVESHEYEVQHAYDSELIQHEDVASAGLGLDPAAVGENLIVNRGEGWVSLPELLAELSAEFVERGGVIRTGLGMVDLWVEDGRSAGTVLDDGTIVPADAVVVACGAKTPAFFARHGVEIPDASPLAMLVITEPLDEPAAFVMNTPRAAVRPNPGNTLAVDHDWYEDQLVDLGDGDYSVPAPVVDQLMSETSGLYDHDIPLKAASYKIGYKPVPGDGEPVLGEVSALPGCYAAFTHSGATLALIVGELLSGEIVSGRRHPMLASFSPDRFTRR